MSEARALFEQALRGKQHTLRPEHPSALTTVWNLAGLTEALGYTIICQKRDRYFREHCGERRRREDQITPALAIQHIIYTLARLLKGEGGLSAAGELFQRFFKRLRELLRG